MASPSEIARYELRTGDIVVARTGASTGRSQWIEVDEPAVFASYLVRFRVADGSCPRFVAYTLASSLWRQHVASVAHGKSAQPNMSAGEMALFEFECPSYEEQCAIAEVLGALDDKIAANANLAGTVDGFLGVLLASLLASTSVDEVALKDIADVNSKSMKPASNGSLRYIDIASVGVGRYDFPEIVDWAGAPSRARRCVRKGDTLWSTVRPNRRSHALNLSDDPLLVGSTGLAVLSPRETGFAYLYEVTKLAAFTTYLESVAEGSAYPAVRADRFSEAPVPLLTRSARETFESVAEPMRMHVYSLREQNRLLELIRDALLPQLMSGKIRVTDAEKTVKAGTKAVGRWRG